VAILRMPVSLNMKIVTPEPLGQFSLRKLDTAEGDKQYMLVESIVAFILILSAASIVYVLGRRVSPKPVQSEAERSTYACGEKSAFQGLKVNISLYKFLIYFVIFDSAVLLLAFAALMTPGTSTVLIILYLLMMLASTLILFEGGND
jgi:NADH:ubiquinone oxidoreductase subunit 3 (subunit A)